VFCSSTPVPLARDLVQVDQWSLSARALPSPQANTIDIGLTTPIAPQFASIPGKDDDADAGSTRPTATEHNAAAPTIRTDSGRRSALTVAVTSRPTSR
jgi:hypothetical protein